MKITASDEKRAALDDALAAESASSVSNTASVSEEAAAPQPAAEPTAPGNVTHATVSEAPGLVLDDETVRELAVDVIKTIFDPEIPVNIWELGLVYDVTVPQPGYVHVLMTLTAPNCPAAQSLPGEVTQKLIQTPGIQDAEVEITFEPAWEMSRMSEAARLQLGLM